MAEKNLTVRDVIAMIEEARERLGLSQAAAAREAGVSQPFWNLLAKDQSRGADITTLKRMAEAVGLEVRITVKRKR